MPTIMLGYIRGPMKHLLLAAGLLLAGLAGCHTNSPDPTPTPANTQAATVVAKWQIDSTWVSGGTATSIYQKNGLKLYAPGTAYTELTQSQYIVYAGNTINKQYPYTQAGSVLHINGGGGYNDATIKTLTVKRMVLVSLSPSANGQANQYLTSTITYSR